MDLASLRQMFVAEGKGLWHQQRGNEGPTVDDPMAIPLHWVSTEWQLSDILTTDETRDVVEPGRAKLFPRGQDQ